MMLKKFNIRYWTNRGREVKRTVLAKDSQDVRSRIDGTVVQITGTLKTSQPEKKHQRKLRQKPYELTAEDMDCMMSRYYGF